jgi:Mg/Co/Ni transporter MgtE
VNEADQLLGVIDIKQLFMAEDDVLLSNLMVENIISLNPDSTMEQAADAFIRYGFRALPVTSHSRLDAHISAPPIYFQAERGVERRTRQVRR